MNGNLNSDGQQNEQSPLTLTNKKKRIPRHMTLEIQVLA